MATALVVDDDEALREALAKVLTREGFEVQTAADGVQAVARYLANPTDLVITDILMPEKEGLQTIMEIRRANPSVKIIAISGGGEVEASIGLRPALHLGADLALTKPFNVDRILEAIHTVLDE